MTAILASFLQTAIKFLFSLQWQEGESCAARSTETTRMRRMQAV